MKKEFTDTDKRLIMKLSDIPLESSLGLLAYGDIAFEAWREKKKQANINQIEVKEDGKK